MTSPPARRSRGRGHELRGVLVRAASDLLAQLGDVDALTMRAVATAAGVTPPSVYRHFPDKETLVRAVVTQRFDAFTRLLGTAADSAGNQPMARLEAMTLTYVRAGLEQPGHYRVLFSATNAGPAGLGLPQEEDHPGAASFRMLVEAVAASLPPRRRPAAHLLATELWASLHGIVDLRITKPEMPWPDPPQLLDAALTAVRAAATANPPTATPRRRSAP